MTNQNSAQNSTVPSVAPPDIKPRQMELWNSVCETDPSMTKHVGQRGGFTAIAAQYQIREATKMWGPYGKDWGVKECDYIYIGPEEKTYEVSLDAIFFYPEGSFEISTDIAYKPGNDTRKKLLTDLTTKALSKLGFNADVFMGMYDDNKYVEEMKQKFSPHDDVVKHTSNQKEKYMTLLHSDNALGFYCFLMNEGPNIESSLFGSHEEGKKTEYKKLHTDLKQKGKELFDQYKDNLITHIDNQDKSGVDELKEEMGKEVFSLIWALLPPEHQSILRAMKK